MSQRLFRFAVAIVSVSIGSQTNWAVAIQMETVFVGNVDNHEDSINGYRGSVSYNYRIGKYEVTAGQYCVFLNAVAKTDTYGLYNPFMADPQGGVQGYGCNIQRSGSIGNYIYSIAPDWANRPVNWISWGDAARFCNWLTNGQPTTGVQNASTTEDGSYTISGATSNAALMDVTRKANARYVIPTADEWHKAAYYDPSKPWGAGYWDYPTRSDNEPSNVLSDPTDPGNNATFNDHGHTLSTYCRTEVGAHENSESAYGTFDQGGNVMEWNELDISGMYRGFRGGSFRSSLSALHASSSFYENPMYESDTIGFRIATVPEPVTLMTLALGGAAIIKRKYR